VPVRCRSFFRGYSTINDLIDADWTRAKVVLEAGKKLTVRRCAPVAGKRASKALRLSG